MSERASIGIHEILRYAMPGYSFLLVLSLPFVACGVPLVADWERYVALFLIGGFVVGYVLYYPYYRIFATRLYTENNRASLKKARLLLGRTEVDEDVLALHSIALGRTKETEASRDCLFQFTVFHSIGTTILSILSAYALSLIITVLQFSGNQQLLIAEGIMALVVLFFAWVFRSEYLYRFKVALRMEDYLVMQGLEATLKEFKSVGDEIQKQLPKKLMRC